MSIKYYILDKIILNIYIGKTTCINFIQFYLSIYLSIYLSTKDEEEQRKLEEQHRMEEEKLYNEFVSIRMKEEEKAIQGIQEEWEIELSKITAKFERDLQMKVNKLIY